MRAVAFDGTFAGWRASARVLLGEGVAHHALSWQAHGETTALALPLSDPGHDFTRAASARVPRDFLRLASAVACHRDPTRWDALYRALWRLTHGEPSLLQVVTDPDVHALMTMERAVRRAAHKMKAFVRFREVASADDGAPRYVAWFEPAQNVVERVAPFFARRFASMCWSILTPDRCAHWDRDALSFTEGVTRAAAPSDDALEDLWRTYYSHIFNPARLNLDAMRAEMPQRYWKDLPEARLVSELTREAPRRVAAMLAQSSAPAEALPAELRATHDVGTSPTLAVQRDARTPRRDLALPGLADPAHDPGTIAAVVRAERAADHPRGGVVLGDARVLIGAAGWTDPTLTSGGIFYPPEVSTADDRLRHYASRFPFVEVDATYYALPTRGMAAAWAARTPDHFVFDVKAHALMTGHAADVRQLPDWLRRALPPRVTASGNARIAARDVPHELIDELWTRFLHALEPLRASGKLGALLLQFPRWFLPTRESATMLRRARERLGATLGAVELRNRAWMDGRIGARTLALLRDLELAYVMVDAPPGMESSMPATVAVTTPRLAVIRLHGRRVETWEARNDPASERYRYLYDHDQLAEWVSRLPDIAQRTQGVHVVCNNCHANYGTTNADEITAMLVEADELRRRMGRENRLRGRVVTER